MPQLLLRDISNELNEWIDEQSYSLRTSKKEFVLSLLSNAWQNKDDEMPLFAGINILQTSRSAGLPFTFIDLFAGIGGFRLGLGRV